MAARSFDKMSKSKGKFATILWLLLLAVAVMAIVLLVRFYELERPQVTLVTDVTLLGGQGNIDFSVVDEKTGVQEIKVVLRQDKKEVTLYSKVFYKQGLLGKGPQRINESISYSVKDLGFSDGRADLLITARDFSFWQWMKGNEITSFYPVAFDAKPPSLRLVDSPVAIKPGSSGVIVYRSNEEIYNHGVMLDDNFYLGFPVHGRAEGTYAALIGIPYDTEKIGKAFVRAQDKAGNAGKMAFGLNIRKIKKKTDRINISDGFLDRKIPEFGQYYPEMTGEFVDQYIYVNNEVRTQNAAQISAICQDSVPEQLWEGKFERMKRSSRRAGFAEYRSYYYKNKKIDNQVHLGIDLASVRRAAVESANSGRIVFADYLGIYGNMVIVDHGQGLFSLYSHMSEISVSVGDTVAKRGVLGKTGTTGMAGGDHLHFSMLVNGIFVNPIEWWDKSWIRLHILDYLKP